MGPHLNFLILIFVISLGHMAYLMSILLIKLWHDPS